MYSSNAPFLRITEQPKQRGMRFRYECEGRSAGSIPGENTTQERKTWPTVQIQNFRGEVTIRVSLVSKDSPPKPHPHSLVGKDCENGICTVHVSSETQMTACFSNLGIQCVKRKEVSDALIERRRLNVDPFKTVTDGDERPNVDIDLNIVRLCFEAFCFTASGQMALQPVVSNPIFDKKATSSSLLRICRVDKSFGSCKGGDEVYLLCDKVQKDDISICFFDLNTGWESYGEFSPTDVHRQVAIVFRTPSYENTHIREATKVMFQLKRSSDGETSDSKDFTYLPLDHEQPHMKVTRAPLKRHLDESVRQAIRTKAISPHAAGSLEIKRPRESLTRMPMHIRPSYESSRRQPESSQLPDMQRFPFPNMSPSMGLRPANSNMPSLPGDTTLDDFLNRFQPFPNLNMTGPMSGAPQMVGDWIGPSHSGTSVSDLYVQSTFPNFSGNSNANNALQESFPLLSHMKTVRQSGTNSIENIQPTIPRDSNVDLSIIPTEGNLSLPNIDDPINLEMGNLSIHEEDFQQPKTEPHEQHVMAPFPGATGQFTTPTSPPQEQASSFLGPMNAGHQFHMNTVQTQFQIESNSLYTYPPQLDRNTLALDQDDEHIPSFNIDENNLSFSIEFDPDQNIN